MYLLMALVFSVLTAHSDPVFRFHLIVEPQALDPQVTASASGNYLFFNLYRGLYRYHGEKGLILEGAKSCRRGRLTMTCTLNPRHKWSNGKPIRAQDYVAAFRRLIDPQVSSPQSDVLFNVKNARAIWQKKLPVEQLGVRAVDDKTLRIEFSEEDPEFEYKLIHPALTPLPVGGYPKIEDYRSLITSGPYKIREWKKGARVLMSSNEHYGLNSVQRPEVEALFVENDATALRLYESKKLNFNRRLVASEFHRFEKSPEFQQIPMARFDYVGFGPELKDQPALREALVKGIEFDGFLKLFGARTTAGCPSLPAKLMDRVTCQRTDLKKARELLKSIEKPPKLKFFFSLMGGDDIARAAEWFQGQWKKNLNFEMELQGKEQGTYLPLLRHNPPALFRKGVSLDRPTCQAALEIFTKGHPENFIRLEDAHYDVMVKKVGQTKGLAQKKACREAVEYLLKTNRLIPLGEMHFTILARPEFSGWNLNELNQLDLSELQFKTRP